MSLYCWSGSINEFLKLGADRWLEKMTVNFISVFNENPSEQQIMAWQDCFKHLAAQFNQLSSIKPDSKQWTLIFEYQLPRQGGRRPDLVILAEGNIIVLEFKCKEAPRKSDLFQLAGYVRDIAHYHQASQERPIKGLLVLTKASGNETKWHDFFIISPENINKHLTDITPADEGIDVSSWINSRYEPLPTLVQAARALFKDEPLPQIKQANSAGIPLAVALLRDIAAQAQQKGERHLVLVTGVPGAGKTLLGLQFAYDEDINKDKQRAVFLSGNGPLVQVLQYALGNDKTFVQSLNHYLKEYAIHRRGTPPENILVFDEAQRAWDAERVQKRHPRCKHTEPELIIQLSERIPGWSLVLGLIGEGQEIHVGEEGGLGQWNSALANANLNWQVYCPAKIANHFTAVNTVNVNEYLNLTKSLRSHIAQDVQHWIKALLAGDVITAKSISDTIPSQKFFINVIRDIELAKEHCRRVYQGMSDKRYGLLASSKAQNLATHGVYNEYKHKAKNNFEIGPYYVDPPQSANSCCALNKVATEFSCQGLELDLPIVCWGDDLIWKNNGWQCRGRNQAKDPRQLCLNSYRVLLSRGRDGLIIFVPRGKVMDETFNLLVRAGARK